MVALDPGSSLIVIIDLYTSSLSLLSPSITLSRLHVSTI